MADNRWKTYHGVGVLFDEQVVRVKNDLTLKAYLHGDSGRSLFRRLRSEYRMGMRMALALKAAYRRKFGEELEITDGSLSTEIVWHYRVIEMCRICRKMAIYRIPPVRRFVEWLWVHMDVIDCGKREIDTNRFVWDIFDRMGI